jgi:hypothetical protein
MAPNMCIPASNAQCGLSKWQEACRIGPRSDDMPFFRMRLILALIVGITLVSVGSTYFDVLATQALLCAAN